MTEINSAIKLRGWQGVIALLVVLGIAGVRLATLDDNLDDAELMQKLQFQLTSEYFPDDVAELKSIYESGDMKATSRAVKSITSSKISIESVQVSAPLFSSSSNQKVIVKVTYSLDDAFGNRSKGTKYYRFRHGGLLGGNWTYQHESGPISYYLNFL